MLHTRHPTRRVGVSGPARHALAHASVRGSLFGSALSMDQTTVSLKRRRKETISSYRDEVVDSDEDNDSQRISNWVASTSRHVSTHVTDRSRRSYTTSYLAGVDHPHIPSQRPLSHNNNLESDIYAHVDPHFSVGLQDGQGSDASGRNDSSDSSDADDSEDEDDTAAFLASGTEKLGQNKRVSLRLVLYCCAPNSHFHQSKALHEWVPHRNALLEELHRHNGRDSMNSCTSCCEYVENLYRCIDCFAPSSRCAKCIRECHGDNVLHRIEVRTSHPSIRHF